MIGRTLFIYIAWRFFLALIAMMSLLFFLIVVIDFIENLRRIKGEIDATAGDVFSISLLTAPFYIDKAFPFAVLFAAMNTLFNLNQKLELVVARAAGVSAWQFLLPIAAVALFVGVFTSTIYNSNAIKWFHTSIELKAEKLKFHSPLFASGKKGFWLRQLDEGDGSSVIKAALARNRGVLLDDVKILRFDAQGSVYQTIEAEKAEYKDGNWHLTDAISTDTEQKITQFPTLNVPTNVKEEYLLGTANSPDQVDIWNLKSAATKVALSGINHLPYLVQFQSLLALPFQLLAMVLIAATVSLRFVRSGQAGRLILGGIFAGFVLYAATRVIASLGSNGIVSPTIAAWSPSIVAILFGISMLLHQEDG